MPEGYELVAGTKFENIHLYYDCMQTAIVGDLHHIKMILNVPLKTANRHFMLYRILALPTRISNGTFVQYVPISRTLELITFVVYETGIVF